MGVYIKNVAYYLPEVTVSNEDLQSEFKDRDVGKMANKIGVFRRHVAGPDETALDLAEKAAKKLFEENDKDDIDFVILCTQSPDYYLPTTACILQHRLGISKNAGAIDINQGCSGFVYSLSLAKGLVEAGVSKNVLLVMAETYSKHINEGDLGNRIIFGDAASAILVSHTQTMQVGNFVLGTDGEGANNLIVPNGGLRNRFDSACEVTTDQRNDRRTDNDLFMNGSEIFYFAGKQIPSVVEQTLAANNLTKGEVDFYLFHQANKYMIDFLAKRLKLSADQYYFDIEDIGNTVSSTIPIALKRCLDKGIIQKGDKVLLCGFGVGYSWGSVVVEI